MYEVYVVLDVWDLIDVIDKINMIDVFTIKNKIEYANIWRQIIIIIGWCYICMSKSTVIIVVEFRANINLPLERITRS
jgi:hypothetical protein